MKTAVHKSWNALGFFLRTLPGLTFGLFVIMPSAAAICYYTLLASPQYVSEAHFAVRGIGESQLSFLAMGNILGSSPQAPDSYVVVDYVRSTQLVRDLAERGLDLRSFYSKPEIDLVERINPDLPIDFFVDYWNRKAEISYNSTTGNVTFRVRAFTPADAKAIGDAVMASCHRLVTQLAAGARQQLISAAQAEVERTGQRLTDVRQRLLTFREREQAVDLQQIATVEQTVISDLETRLTSLETRRRSIDGQLSADSPTIKVLDSQITAIRQQLDERRSRLGAGGDISAERSAGGSLSAVADEFRQLTFEQGYSETAYTQALASLEAAAADARKQDRYFAVFASPQLPDVPTEPNRLFLSLLVTIGSAGLWGIGALIVHAIRERAT